jgi:hypothetical protein
MPVPIRNARLNEVLRQLRNLPYANRLIVFGSVAAGKVTPFDVDVAVLDRETPFRCWAQPTPYGALLRLARRYYGDLDPFLGFADVLICRNAQATAWQAAIHARALLRSIPTNGRPLAEIGPLSEE